MELQDTVPMMLSEDYKERFRAEYDQLGIRIARLGRMLGAYEHGALGFDPKCSADLLAWQLNAMRAYKLVLERRAQEEAIEL